jgi:5-methylcytosine-specific restriction endonuclease McrA
MNPETKWATRQAMYAAQRGICPYCERHMTFPAKGANRRKRTDATVDHLLPRSRGGTSRRGNLILCCSECNSMKGSKVPEAAIDLINAEPEVPPFDGDRPPSPYPC